VAPPLAPSSITVDEGRPQSVTDDSLIAGAKAGDPDAWRELYRLHAGRLVVWLANRGAGDGASGPEDLGNEAWLLAAEKIKGFHGSSDDFAGWLFGIARKLAANARRTSERRQTSPMEFVPDDVVAGPESFVPEADWVREAMSHLSARERDVIACTEVVGLDVAGASAALGMTTVAVRVTRHRALKRLRAAYEASSQSFVPHPLGA